MKAFRFVEKLFSFLTCAAQCSHWLSFVNGERLLTHYYFIKLTITFLALNSASAGEWPARSHTNADAPSTRLKPNEMEWNFNARHENEISDRKKNKDLIRMSRQTLETDVDIRSRRNAIKSLSFHDWNYAICISPWHMCSECFCIYHI